MQATSPRNARAMTVAVTVAAASLSESSRRKAASTFSARKIELVEAEVIPEESTAKVTMKVRKCTPKDLCTYRTAPAACGYLVTISTQSSALTMAIANAM